MGDSAERFVRIVRAPEDDPFIIRPPQRLLDEAERLGQDPRRPRTAVARWVSSAWAESRREAIRRGPDAPEPLDARPSEKELMERPAHYPSDFGLGLIPFPDDIGGWVLDKTETTCYTSLSTPRPFDPHLHASGTPLTPGWGYGYHGSSPFPDRYDVVNRRGGGPRGGFAFTTGPTEGNYPSTILPSPTFDLGVLGFSDGGWNPEGLAYTNRPRRMRLTGLRNGWPHRVFFVRSRQVFFRNLYGPIASDEATPQAPLVVINGTRPIHGLLGVTSSETMNAPRRITVRVSSVVGRRSGVARVGDTVQVFMAPRRWANPPLVFTGFVSDVQETASDVVLTCLDPLGFLANETLTDETVVTRGDAAAVIKNVIAGSAYAPPIGRISAESLVTVPAGMRLKGKTRLAAVQTALGFINIQPKPMVLYADASGYIHLRSLPEVDDSNLTPLVAGRLPRTAVPQDLYPTRIERNTGDLDFFNVVVVKSTTLDNEPIEVVYPDPDSASFPSRPVHRVVTETSVTDESQAVAFARLMLANQGRTSDRYIVECLPERFDIRPGDVVEFASSAGLAGRHRVFDVSWEFSPDGPRMTLSVGRQAPNLVATLRYAAGVSL